MTNLSTVSKKPSAAARREALRLPALRMADRLIASERDRKTAARPSGLQTKATRRRAKLLARTPVTARDTHVEPIAQVMDDPFEPGGKLEVQVNRRTDILKEERSHSRISEAAFVTGREVQAVFEKAQRRAMPARNWLGGDRVDAADAHEESIAKALDAAQAADREMGRLIQAVGEIGARFLREIIAEGVSFADYAARRGWSGDRKVTYVAVRFRGSLEDLAEFRAAEGKAAPAPADKHSDAWRRAMAARRD